MHDTPVKAMLDRYHCQTLDDYENAIKEIIQELALLGLYRAKFFEHAAFYGGTALRILYQLNRFSEDMDFTLLQPNKAFTLAPYNSAIKQELQAFGFTAEVETKIKNFDSQIESAFIKLGTQKEMLTISAPLDISKHIPAKKKIKIKFEVDVDPPLAFATEMKRLLLPIPFNVRAVTLPNLFAGKIHALLCRQWKTRVKGRDWYDFYWYVARGIAVNLKHLAARLVQSGHLASSTVLDLALLKQLMLTKIEQIDFAQAKLDVKPFLQDPDAVELWDAVFFQELVGRLRCE